MGAVAAAAHDAEVHPVLPRHPREATVAAEAADVAAGHQVGRGVAELGRAVGRDALAVCHCLCGAERLRATKQAIIGLTHNIRSSNITDQLVAMSPLTLRKKVSDYKTSLLVVKMLTPFCV